MTLYDDYGRRVFVTSWDFTLSDTRYVRKDINDSLSKDYDWTAVAGNNMRIKSGKLQVKNEDTSLWHNVRIKNVDGNATIFPDDVPIA